MSKQFESHRIGRMSPDLAHLRSTRVSSIPCSISAATGQYQSDLIFEDYAESAGHLVSPRRIARGRLKISPQGSHTLTKQRKLQSSEDSNFCESPEIQRLNRFSLEGEQLKLLPQPRFHGNLTSSDYDSSAHSSFEDISHGQPVSVATFRRRPVPIFWREDSDLTGGRTKNIMGSSGSITEEIKLSSSQQYNIAKVIN